MEVHNKECICLTRDDVSDVWHTISEGRNGLTFGDTIAQTASEDVLYLDIIFFLTDNGSNKLSKILGTKEVRGYMSVDYNVSEESITFDTNGALFPEYGDYIELGTDALKVVEDLAIEVFGSKESLHKYLLGEFQLRS